MTEEQKRPYIAVSCERGEHHICPWSSYEMCACPCHAASQEQEQEQERGGLRCVQGCYIVQYANALESGGPGWYPLHWLEEAWRAYFSIGYFELVALRYPTRQEALDYVYSQP